MKYIVVSVVLLLGACVGSVQKQIVLQDQHNIDKFNELKNKVQVPDGCEKLGKLYDFKQLKSPTINELAKIMPIFGLKEQDAIDIDKVYGIDFSSIKHYQCDNVDNTDKLKIEAKEYCDSKYLKDSYEQKYCVQYLNKAVFNNDKYRHKRETQELISNYGLSYVLENIEEAVEAKRKEIHPLPEDSEYLLSEFKASELVKANQTVIGTYDHSYMFNGDTVLFECDSYLGHLCEPETGRVTKLNLADILYNYCLSQIFFPDYLDEQKCICYAHSVYNQMSYQNILYVYEKEKTPQSKQAELKQKFNQCEQKIKQRQIKANNARYGESDRISNTVFDEDIVNGFIDSVDNAMWATQQINKKVEKERKKQK